MSKQRTPGNVLFAAARHGCGWHSQDDFADAFDREARRLGLDGVAVSVRQVRRWESRTPPWPTPDYRRVLESLFGMPLGQLGFLAPSYVEAARDPAGEDDDVRRREFLGVATLAGAGLVQLPGTALASTREQVDAALQVARSGGGGVEYVEQAAARAGRGYMGRPPAQVLDDVAADLRGVGALLAGSQPARTRARLAFATAQLSAVAAIVLHDLGARGDAHAWFRTAATAAEDAGDPQLQGWVFARAAMLPLNYGAPSAAAALADRARALAGERPSAAAALAAAVGARAHATLGRRADAYAALDASERIVGRLDPAVDGADTWYGYPEHKHHVHASQALTRLGDTARAGEAQRAAAALSRPSSHMTGALLGLDRAVCLRHQGDVDAGCRVAVQVLTAAPAAYRGGLVHERAVELLGVLTPDQRRLPAARDLVDALHA